MPDLDLAEFKHLGRRKQHKPCGVIAAVASVPEKDRARVLAALESDDGDVRRGVTRWLMQRDLEPPSDSAVSYHRRRRCACHA